MKNAANAVVSKELAIAEVNKWLDFRRITQRERDKQVDEINLLAEYIEDGILILDPKTFDFELILAFETASKKSFTFKPNLTIGEIQRRLSSVEKITGQNLVASYIYELTGLNSGIVLAMNASDYRIAAIIAGFFY